MGALPKAGKLTEQSRKKKHHKQFFQGLATLLFLEISLQFIVQQTHYNQKQDVRRRLGCG